MSNNLTLHNVSSIRVAKATDSIYPFDIDYEILKVSVTLKDGSEFDLHMYGEDGKTLTNDSAIIIEEL